MRLSEKINGGSTSAFLTDLKESIDVYQFTVYEDDLVVKDLCNILKCTPDDILEASGFMFNDSAPEDYLVTMQDGTCNLVNTKSQSFEKFPSRKEASQKLFGDGANYNF